MLHVSVTQNTVRHVVEISFPPVNAGSNIMTPGFPSFLVISQEEGQVVNADISRSYLSQGRIAHGPLRDKSVSHTAVSGDIVIPRSVLTGLPGGTRHYWGPGQKFTGYDFGNVLIGTGSSLNRDQDVEYGFRFNTSIILRVGVWSKDGDIWVITQISYRSADQRQRRKVNNVWLPWSNWTLGTAASRISRVHHWSRRLVALRHYEMSDLDIQSGTWDGSMWCPLGATSFFYPFMDALDVWGYFGTWKHSDPASYVTPQPVHQIVLNSATPSEIIDMVKMRVDDTSLKDYLSIVRPPDFDFGDLTLQILDGEKIVDQNVLFLVFDIADVRRWMYTIAESGIVWTGLARAIRVLVSTGKRRKSIVAKARTMAGLFLYEKYALESCLRDLKRVLEGVKTLGKMSQESNRRHARYKKLLVGPSGEMVEYNAVLTIELSKYSSAFTERVQEVIGNIKKLGLYPRLTDPYDAIPYSFVLDWFVEFGAFLDEEADWLDCKYYLPVSHTIQSEKWTTRVQAQKLLLMEGVSGELRFSEYLRWCDTEVPLPSVAAIGGGSGLNDRWAEAGALVLQRRALPHLRSGT